MRALFATAVLALLCAIPPASARTFAELKTAQQFQADAALYDAAIKAIGALGGQRIATPAELQSAMSLYHSHAPAIGFAAARLIALGYQDSRFTTAIRANLADERLAQDFARRLVADPAIAARLDGAPELKARMAALLQANATAVQRAIDNLHAATLRITGSSPGVKPKYFAPPAATIWDPASSAILATITVTFPPIAATLGKTTTVTATVPGIYNPMDRAISTFLALIRSAQIRADYGTQIDTLRGYADDALQEFREAYAELLESGKDACVARARARYDQCLVEAARLTGDKRSDAQQDCGFRFQTDRAMCSFNPSWDLDTSSLFSPGT